MYTDAEDVACRCKNACEGIVTALFAGKTPTAAYASVRTQNEERLYRRGVADLTKAVLLAFVLRFAEYTRFAVNRGFKQCKDHTVGQICVDFDIGHWERSDVTNLLVEIDVIALKDLARGERRAVFDV